jgi:hypothetical protein
MFCSEEETVHHLFFECVVAKHMWVYISECLYVNLGGCFESIGKFWLSDKKNSVINIFTSAALWGHWKLRNCLCFQNGSWRGVNCLLMHIVNMIHSWKLLCPPLKMVELESRLPG